MKTRIFTLLVAFLTMVGNAVWGQETTTTPKTETIDGKIFYLLGSKEDLKWFQKHVSESEDNASACAKLTDNIDLGNEEWTPIMYVNTSTYEMGYKGIFDGGGFSISGLYINQAATTSLALSNYYGLFGIVGYAKMDLFAGTEIINTNAVVKNLTVKGTIDCNGAYVSTGGIAGLNVATIQGCINEVDLKEGDNASPYGGHAMGGICGNNEGSIISCVNKGDVKSETAGGICAYNGSSIEKCCNEGTISGSTATGGICGQAAVGVTSSINNCYNAGALTAESGNVAGICAVLGNYMSTTTDVTIMNCHNYGTITGKDSKAGICTVYYREGSTDIEVTVSNNYYLEGTADAGFLYTFNSTSTPGTPNDQPGQVEAKSADAFANGEVLYLLQQNNAGVWEQTIGTDDYPVFEATSTPSTVYQVTFNYNYEGSPEAIIYYVEEGESVTVPTLTREGYTFTNWSTDAAGESVAEISGSIIPDASVTYYAQWQEEQTEDPDEGDDDEQGGIVPDAPKYYNIYEDEICEGVTVEFSRDVVKEGQSVLVTVTVDEEFDATKMTLKFKRSLFGYWEDLTLTPTENPNEYIIQNIYTDIYVRAEGAVPIGIEQIAGAQVYTRDGSLFIQTPQPEQVLVISASGAILKNERFAGLRQFDDLQRGVYIICIGNERFKVRI